MPPVASMPNSSEGIGHLSLVCLLCVLMCFAYVHALVWACCACLCVCVGVGVGVSVRVFTYVCMCLRRCVHACFVVCIHGMCVCVCI